MHQRILDVAEALVRTEGYAAVAVEQIATAAGVAKSTIYRWWPSKAHLVLELVLDRWFELGTVAETGDARRDFADFLTVNYRNQAGLGGQVMPLLVSDLPSSSADLSTALNVFVDRRRAMGRQILEQGMARGELPADADVDLILDLAAGVPMAQMMRGIGIRDLHDVDAIVDLVFRGTVPTVRPGRRTDQ